MCSSSHDMCADPDAGGELSVTGALLFQKAIAKLRDALKRLSADHKDIHGSISKTGREIDRVSLVHLALYDGNCYRTLSMTEHLMVGAVLEQLDAFAELRERLQRRHSRQPGPRNGGGVEGAGDPPHRPALPHPGPPRPRRAPRSGPPLLLVHSFTERVGGMNYPTLPMSSIDFRKRDVGVQESGVCLESWKKDGFLEMNEILAALERQELGPAIAWAKVNSHRLKEVRHFPFHYVHGLNLPSGLPAGLESGVPTAQAPLRSAPRGGPGPERAALAHPPRLHAHVRGLRATAREGCALHFSDGKGGGGLTFKN